MANANEALRVERVDSPGKLRLFIRLPSLLQGRRPNYVPPIWSEEKAFHDPRRNAALAGCDTVRLLAWRGKHCVGRIMGIVHHAHNKLHGERTARFYQLDAENDLAVSGALIAAVEQWARENGMNRMIGPFGLSDKDPQGAQVDGFEHLPVVATPTNPAYLPGHIEAAGYSKFSDAVAYRTPIPEVMPEGYLRIRQRFVERGQFRVVPIHSRSTLRPWVLPVFKLVNEAYAGLLGFMPMTGAEMEKLAAQYLPVLQPGLVKVLVDRMDFPVAFVVGVPDMSEGLQKAGGRLFPFGFLRILAAMRRATQLDLLLGAVRPDLQGRGLTSVLAIELLEEARKRGLTHMDSHLVLETNRRMCAEVERLGGRVWKRYRVYGKELD